MRQVGLALVGTGELAQNFHLPIINKMPNAKLVAVCDKIKSKSQSIADKFDIPYTCQNVSELLDIEGIEGVIICTSTDAHTEIAITSIEAGKDVFIEKPVGRNFKETLLIAKTAKNHGRNVMVGMNQRFRQDSMFMKNNIHSNEIGEIFYISAGWLQQKREQQWLEQINRSGGGVLIDLGISLIDLIMWLYDFKAVKSVKATTFNHLTQTAEDVCIASINFEDGSLGTIESSWTLFRSNKTFYCDAYGKKGRVSINPFNVFNIERKTTKSKYQQSTIQKLTILRKSFENEISHFINALLGHGQIHSSINEAVQVMKIIESMYRSANEGTEIIFQNNQ